MTLTPKMVSGLAGLLLVGLLLSWGLGGVWFGSGLSTFQSLTVLTSYNILGFQIPWVNPDFFLKGIPALVTFNFAFFDGGLAYLKYFLYVLSIGVIWGLVVLAISVIGNFWTRR